MPPKANNKNSGTKNTATGTSTRALQSRTSTPRAPHDSVNTLSRPSSPSNAPGSQTYKEKLIGPPPGKEGTPANAQQAPRNVDDSENAAVGPKSTPQTATNSAAVRASDSREGGRQGSNRPKTPAGVKTRSAQADRVARDGQSPAGNKEVINQPPIRQPEAEETNRKRPASPNGPKDAPAGRVSRRKLRNHQSARGQKKQAKPARKRRPQGMGNGKTNHATQQDHTAPPAKQRGEDARGKPRGGNRRGAPSFSVSPPPPAQKSKRRQSQVEQHPPSVSNDRPPRVSGSAPQNAIKTRRGGPNAGTELHTQTTAKETAPAARSGEAAGGANNGNPPSDHTPSQRERKRKKEVNLEALETIKKKCEYLLQADEHKDGFMTPNLLAVEKHSRGLEAAWDKAEKLMGSEIVVHHHKRAWEPAAWAIQSAVSNWEAGVHKSRKANSKVVEVRDLDIEELHPRREQSQKDAPKHTDAQRAKEKPANPEASQQTSKDGRSQHSQADDRKKKAPMKPEEKEKEIWVKKLQAPMRVSDIIPTMSAADKATFRTHMSILNPNANNNGSTGNEMGYLISGYAERILKAFNLHTGALATNNHLNRPPVQLYPEQLLAAPSTLEFASYLKAVRANRVFPDAPSNHCL
ncbi:hypothetical protein PCANC_16383 [Puccinia coronata f. sp. avenae]|uniref:Uncharacterized protein n=1 Tax=Puccinia coronata f. sp. avenae TaxID=200324 RepID=A0A2N5U8C8_9BASI|nr:hypothetical protein PCANC_16383 [Puccinia coronata f. sp. avenae]